MENTFWSRLLQVWRRIHFFEWLYHIYIIITLVWALLSICNANTYKEAVLLTVIAVYLVILLVFVIIYTINNGRKAKYAEALECMHGVMHAARDIYHNIEWAHKNILVYQEAQCKQDLVRLLSEACSAFNITTGVKCHLSLKTVGRHPTDKSDINLFVNTLARDGASEDKLHELDQNEKFKHKVIENTHYELILSGHERRFFHGNLKSLNFYKNSDWILHPNERKISSIIVWPIRYKYKERDKEIVTNGEIQDIYGFLVVDSFSRNVFNDKYDAYIGSVLVDALYPIFQMYYQVYIKKVL